MKQQDPKEIFGRRLSQARRMRGMSLRAVAEAIGGKVSYNALHRYECGEMMPGDEVLVVRVSGVVLDIWRFVGLWGRA